jgi:hypothetical protein
MARSTGSRRIRTRRARAMSSAVIARVIEAKRSA